MKWTKYSGFLLLSFCLFFGLSPLKPVNASTASDYNYIVIVGSNSSYYAMVSNNQSYTVDFNGSVFNFSSTSGLYIVRNSSYQDIVFSSVGEAVNFVLTNDFNIAFQVVQNQANLITVKGETFLSSSSAVPPEGRFFGNYSDYEESIEPSWWDKVKQTFMDFVGSEALSDVLSGNWLAYIEDVLFGELWTVKVGEGEDDMIIPETVSATPTPSPTPIPTPIPYSTIIDPGTGEIHYHYTIDVSGTPVPTSSIYPPVTSNPPGPGSGSTIDEPVAVEDYYEPKDSLSVPKLRIFKFLLRMTGNDVDIGMDSLDDNMAVMDATLEDNAEAISGVGDLFQLIPVKWFLLIGTLACFPVIAAMIKSLLGG